MSWDDFRVLLWFERAGSLAKAAEALAVDKATVSRRIAALEESLDAELVDRRRTGWQLTAHGRTIAEAARAMEEAAGDAEGTVRGGAPRGPVRLTAPVWLARSLLLEHLPRLKETHPGIELELFATNAVLDLGGRQAEVAVRNVRPEQASFVSRKIGVLGSGLYASRAALARDGEPKDRDALRKRSIVAYHDVVTYCPALRWLDALDAPIAFRASDTLVLLDAVRAGLGFAVLPCFLGDRDDALARVLPDEHALDDIFVCYPEELRRLPRVKAVATWVADVFAREQRVLAGRGTA